MTQLADQLRIKLVRHKILTWCFLLHRVCQSQNRAAKKLGKRLTTSIPVENDSDTLHKSTQTADLKTRDAKVQTVSSSHGHELRTDEELHNEGNVDTGSITRIHESQTFLPKGSKTHRRYRTLHDEEDFERKAKHIKGCCEIL